MSTSDPGDPMKTRRTEVLEAIRDSAEPIGVNDIAVLLRIHPNTARLHLDALVSQGLVDRSLEAPSGRGRPRTVYTRRPGMDRGGERRYQLLAKILLGQLSMRSDARAMAEKAGRAWGGYLVESVPPSRRTSATDARRRLSSLLSDLGFAPESVPENTDELKLRHCPFLELAEEYADTLCPLHLGLMQGALTEIRSPIAATRLVPFAEPDACVVHLSQHTRTAASPEDQS